MIKHIGFKHNLLKLVRHSIFLNKILSLKRIFVQKVLGPKNPVLDS